jgi:hypothetical protein
LKKGGAGEEGKEEMEERQERKEVMEDGVGSSEGTKRDPEPDVSRKGVSGSRMGECTSKAGW